MLCQPVLATGTTITWTGDGDGSWHIAGNWNPAQVPVDGDYVIIPESSVVEYVYDDNTSVRLNCAGDLTVSNGTLRLTNPSSSENSSLINGKLNGGGDIIITNGSNLLWSGGSIEGSGSLIINNNANLYATPSSLNRYLVNNGSLLLSGDSLTLTGGAEGSGYFPIQEGKKLEIGGTGTYNLSGQVNNMGILRISDTCRSVQFNSGYSQYNTGTLVFDIGGTEDFNKLEITGNAILNGELKINIRDNYGPIPGDTFEIMTYGSKAGTFSSITSNVPDFISFEPTYNTNSHTLTVAETVADPEGGFAPGSGDGTTLETAFLIATPEHLENVCNYLGAEHTNKYFKLIADIDLSGYNTDEGWVPIGDDSTPFTGTFDGAGHTISNLFIDRNETDYVGLFGYIGVGSEIRNLGLVNVNVIGRQYVGGLVGKNGGMISDCTNVNIILYKSANIIMYNQLFFCTLDKASAVL